MKLPIAHLFFVTLTGGEEPFNHGPHVAGQWLSTAEVARDCRACHDYAKNKDPQSTCLSCHYKGSITVAGKPAEFEKSLNPLREPKSIFQHNDHLRYNCKECHAPASSGPAIVPDDMPLPKGSGICQDCHNPKTTKHPESAEKQAQEKFLKNLNANSNIAEFHPFQHSDHLTPEAMSAQDATKCAVCHDSLQQAGSLDLFQKQLNLKGCESCHRSQNNQAVEFKLEAKTQNSLSAATFPHSKHLSEKAKAADPSIQKLGCFACHVYDEKKTTYGLKPSFGKYEACVSCHAHESWKVADHGAVDNCAGCHTVGFGAMKTNRPQVQVARPQPSGFAMLSQAHPLISSGQTRGQDCAKCHVAEMASFPSAIQGKKFSHATHLPDSPKPEDCLSCHQDPIAKTNKPEEIALSYTQTSCSRCHRGVGIQSKVEEGAAKKAPLFSHAQHLVMNRKDGKPALNCLDCHSPDQSKTENPVGTLAKAMDCSQCHDHRSNAAITGGKNQNYVESCARCHSEGVPFKEKPVAVERGVIASAVGMQFHPTDTDCASCHVVQQRSILESSNAHVFGMNRNSKVHEQAGTPDNCLCCHWDRQQTPKYIPQSLRPKPNQSLAQAVREMLGNSLDGYPGENCKQ